MGEFYGLVLGIYAVFLDLVTFGLVPGIDNLRRFYGQFLEWMTFFSTSIYAGPLGGIMCSALPTSERGD